MLSRTEGNKIRCLACYRYCLLANHQSGFCGVRKNEDGLKLMVENLPMGINIDPIEKKPVLHMLPGSRILSFGTSGCNFACRYCQNYEMSQRRTPEGYYMEPEDVVSMAIKYKCDGIAYTYNEPTIFMEYAREIGLIAHKYGLINIFVTNGYETPEAVEEASKFLDAMTIDFKGNGNESFYKSYISIPRPDYIYDTINLAFKKNIHVEITDLIIPEIGDDLESARYMLERIKNISDEIPVSFLKYHPDYLLKIHETDFNTLLRHYELARSIGMKYVYIGNVLSRYENTYCPNCNNLLIKREWFSSYIKGIDLNGKCKKCGYDTKIILKKRPVIVR
ncbi:AmmeMemoRadiSam system radical SAM enzyme [Picrophilus oshimae]|uniref:Pyruvate formate-lyase activating enzyme n=1 Tax=Picrophilus torridus (strain ATCC 700027 / DSM 9790 / JCM 10055 / NBRC 100828 / KAW 2/3) TaxID=1122961 RepID=Q6L0F8_PICTO|nr:AmmeMemoRadiSam system radical SAM enzyme [Picrophilus oshimae]AAT43544.1 pyruvate formate-lyase activating enzyme [Picrophilus oshimae DSM 9789]